MTTLLSLNEFVTGLEYHEDLNPKLWKDYKLLPDVAKKLDEIAANFIAFLKMDESKITEVVITGSNCNYNYSSQSDIDLHVIAQFDPDATNDAGVDVQDSFTAFKTLYNDSHHISVSGYPIEVYVQPTSEHFTSNAGVYSLTNLHWLQQPVRQHISLDSREIERKAKPIMREIDRIVHGKMATAIALPKIKAVKHKIKQLRAAGLEAGGEFGVENLAFKTIRNLGFLDKLSKYHDAIQDASLSL
jgi:predicted nucleotidyltransferase